MIRPPDHSAPTPLFSQIVEQIRWQVAVGSLRPGAAVPATRDAATAWGVHRHTVARAYRELRDAGILAPGTRGRLVVGSGTGTRSAHAPGVESFVRETLDVARNQLGLTPTAVLAALRTHASEAIGVARACVVECSPERCEDLRRQVERDWQVHVETFCLADRGTPPEMPWIAPLFHVEAMRARWPERIVDARFVTTSLDPVTRDLVEHVTSGVAHPEIALLIVGDPAAGLGLIEDLEALLGSEHRLRLEILEGDAAGASAPAADVVLATTGAFTRLALDVRSRPTVIRLREAITPRDLAALGPANGWIARAPRPARVHVP